MKLNESAVVCIILASCLFSGTTYLAAGNDLTSEANVTFKANTKPIRPVDPGEGEEIEANRPPTEGPLSINYASNLEFGKQKKALGEQVFYAQNDQITVASTKELKTVPNFVQITDLRGTASGWRLSVKQNGPLKKQNGAKLTGSSIVISAGNVESMYGFPDKPTGLKKNQLLLEDGQSHEILNAEPGTGVSTWNIYLGKSGDLSSGIRLIVPDEGVPEVGRYQTSLTWVLTDAL